MRKNALRVVAVAAVVALVATGCSTKATRSGGATGTDGVRTGPGVTADTITLAALTDMSGPFAPIGKQLVQVGELVRAEVNNSGGVCGRKLEFQVSDHGYNVQKAVTLYKSMEPNSLAFLQILGAPINAALAESVTRDKVLTLPATFAQALLANPYVVLPGATYDLELVNGVAYLAEQGRLARGDAIGHIYQEGEYGASALAGSRYAAEKLGLKLVQRQVKATEEDMASYVTSLKAEGVKAVLLTTSPKQTASVAAVAKSVGLEVPLVGNNPTFTQSLLDTPAGPALRANFLWSSTVAPLSADRPGPKAALAAYTKAYPNEKPSYSVGSGYGAAKVFVEIVRKACQNKDLTRDGMAKAFRQLGQVDTGGVFPPLDFSKPGKPSTTASGIAQPDPALPGGLKEVRAPFVSDLAKEYPAGADAK
ncbi:ABC transporter substrate-binding protein [Planosporangium flavigriseum]|uniref:Branched-chain amino acid ABC transporter substrate-binding protein n=1 Tax=Planosporangium flavigriseum TaxID=373681 RepID=A0A8J3PQP5_9ACTN|nr:ABC transporter substrate-binding protein [Planosporangium flavigriseum]NJC67865.1 ABC transporter substrate-binding protein [Planosporangium flavigriseum]GIG76316.1 branched-chain amino acid ABC transporter substrate-binding protein [Planosporangium flavigriseum]